MLREALVIIAVKWFTTRHVQVIQDTDEIFDDGHVPQVREHAGHCLAHILPQDAERVLVIHGLQQLAQHHGVSVVAEPAAASDEAMEGDPRPHSRRDVPVEVVASKSSCFHVALQCCAVLSDSCGV